MKRSFYSALFVIAICSTAFVGCNGDYTANPDGASTTIVNPLKPLSASQFNWTGSGALSATINGVSFVSDSTTTTMATDSVGGIIVFGISGSRGLSLYLKGTYSGGLFQMNLNSYNTYATYADSIGDPTSYYNSYTGNSGEVLVTENDSAYLKGEFYFEGVSSTGDIKAINKGYFNIHKL